MPSRGHPTLKVGHSEEQRVTHFFFRISTDWLFARSLTSLQWLRVRLKGVVTVCPIISRTKKVSITETKTRLRHKTNKRAARLRRKTESNNSSGDPGDPDSPSPTKAAYPSDTGRAPNALLPQGIDVPKDPNVPPGGTTKASGTSSRAAREKSEPVGSFWPPPNTNGSDRTPNQTLAPNHK